MPKGTDNKRKYKLTITEVRRYLLGDKFSEVLQDEDRDVLNRVFAAIKDTTSSLEYLMRSQGRLLTLTGYLREKYAAVADQAHDNVKEVMAEQADVVRDRLAASGKRPTEKSVADGVLARKSVKEARRLAQLSREFAGHMGYLYSVADNRKYTLHELSRTDRQREEVEY